MMNRREWLYGMGVMAGAIAQPGASFAVTQKESPESEHHPLELSEFEPKSMLRRLSPASAAQFPVIDFHTHITDVSEVRQWGRVVRCSKVSGYTGISSASHGSQEHSGHG